MVFFTKMHDAKVSCVPKAAFQAASIAAWQRIRTAVSVGDHRENRSCAKNNSKGRQTMKKNMMRFFSMLLAFCMVVGYVPVYANATETVEAPAAVVETKTAENAKSKVFSSPLPC